MNNYAPVLIITLNRYDHLKKCVESLSACTYADSTDLYIAVDYPTKESHWEGYNNINNYLAEIKGFKSVFVIKRKENFGPVRNHLEAQSRIFEEFDRIIFSEDDNVFSPNFLDFVNKGLNKYKDDSSIFSISGYNYPISIPESYNQNVYLWTGFSAWGVGLWRDKWSKIDWNEDTALKKVRKFLNNYNQVIRFDMIANNYVPALIKMIELNTLHGDGYICMMLFANNMYSIFPTVSRVRNLGHDGTGMNCHEIIDDIYKDQELYSGLVSYELPLDVKLNNDLDVVLKVHWKRSIRSRIKVALKLFFMNLGLYC